MPYVAVQKWGRNVWHFSDQRALAEEYLGRSAAVAVLVVVLGDVLVEVVELRVLAGDDERVGEDAGACLVREVLADDRLVDDDAVRDVEERAAREERGVKGGESIAVCVHKGEQARFDQVAVLLRRDSQRLEDDALRQSLGEDQLLTIEVLEPRELVRVEPADVGAAPLLVGLAGRGQLLEGRERALAPLAQPARFALELVQGLAAYRHLSRPSPPSRAGSGG